MIKMSIVNKIKCTLLATSPFWGAAMIILGVQNCKDWEFRNAKTLEGTVIEEKYFIDHRSGGNGYTHWSEDVKVYEIDVQTPKEIKTFDYDWINEKGKEIDKIINKGNIVQFKEGYRPYEEKAKRR